MMIDGPTTTRDDGSTVVIGYGVDSDDKVTGRFAVPSGHEWDAPDATESVEFVETIDNLPRVDSDYKTES